jgi:PAP2 superfamily protein
MGCLSKVSPGGSPAIRGHAVSRCGQLRGFLKQRPVFAQDFLGEQIRARPDDGRTPLLKTLRTLWKPLIRALRRAYRSVARELVVVALFGLAYVGVRELTEGGAATAIKNGARLARLEEHVGLGWEHGFQSVVLGRRALGDLANWMYIWGHWPLIAVIAITLFSVRRDRYRLLRNAVIISGLIGFLFFALFPTAPPRLVDAGLVDTITRWSDSYRTLQPPRFTNQYAAIPSLHFGWNLLVGIILFGSTRSLVVRAFSILMPAAMAFAVVATANHWVVDVFAGAAVVLVGLALAKLADRSATAWNAVHTTEAPALLLYSRGSASPDRVAGPRAVPRRASRGEPPRSSSRIGVPRRRTRPGRRTTVPRSR